MMNNVHDSITSFIRMRPSLLHNTDGTDYAFPTPRTWAMLNRKLPYMTDDFYGCASLIGDGLLVSTSATEPSTKICLTSIRSSRNPAHQPCQLDTSILFAVSGALAARRTQPTSTASCGLFDACLPVSVITVRDSIANNKTWSLLTASPSGPRTTQQYCCNENHMASVRLSRDLRSTIHRNAMQAFDVSTPEPQFPTHDVNFIIDKVTNSEAQKEVSCYRFNVPRSSDVQKRMELQQC